MRTLQEKTDIASKLWREVEDDREAFKRFFMGADWGSQAFENKQNPLKTTENV
jgi:hypothetical protein